MAAILGFHSHELKAQLIKQAFIRVYPPHGFQAFWHLDKIAEWSKRPYFSWLTLAAAFIGIPCRQTRLYGEDIACRKMTFWDLWLNFLGVNTVEPLSTRAWIWQLLIKPCFFIPVHCLKIIFSLPLNLAKFFTEFLPLCIIAFSIGGVKSSSWIQKFFSFVGLGLGYFYLCVGRASTSPWTSLLFAWHEGQQIAGLFGALSFLILRVILNLTVLFIFWPFILQAILPSLIPSLVIGMHPLAIINAAIYWIKIAILVDGINKFVFVPLSNWYFRNKDGGYEAESKSTHLPYEIQSHDLGKKPVRGFIAQLFLEEQETNRNAQKEKVSLRNRPNHALMQEETSDEVIIQPKSFDSFSTN